MSDTIKMNMVEKVARAQAVVCSDCKKFGEVNWKAHLEDARAAIAAMREPSEEMLAVIEPSDDPGSLGIYQAMIDAALKE